MDVDDLDPRQRRTRQNVLASARVVLRRDGLQGATMEAIAAESGVARSTLYRNWPSREALLDDAIAEVAVPAPPSGEHDPLDRLAEVVEHLARNLDTSRWGELLPAIVAAIDASPEVAARYRGFVDGRRRDVKRIVRDAVAAGTLPSHVDADHLVDDLVGPLFYRRLVRRVPTSASWARAHTERTLAAHRFAQATVRST